MRSRPIYQGAIYFAENVIRYGIFIIKVDTYILIHPISCYNFWGTKLNYHIIMSKKIEKRIANQVTCWIFLFRHVYREHYLHFGYVGSIMFKPSNLQSHPSNIFQQKNYLFSSTSTNPILDLLPLVIVSTLFYMYVPDKRGHYMWWYFTCKHVPLS